MGLLNWMSGGYRADDEQCADVVRQYLTTHDINLEQWTGVKGESAVRIYAGEGTRAGRKVGFYVKLGEADMKPTGVVIPEKYGLATYAHHWRKLWAMDRRWPLYEYMLRQMPGAYEELDGPGKQLSDDETMNMAMEVSNYAISAMLRNGFSEDDVVEKRPFLLMCARQAIMLAQVDNIAANRKDVPQELCDTSTKAVDKWLDFQFANKTFADKVEQMIEDIRKKHGDDYVSEARRVAFDVHSTSCDEHKDDYKRNFADTLAAIKEYADFLDTPEPPPAPAPVPARLTNEQFAAEVYKIITERTGINYQEAYKLCITKEGQEKIHELILSFANQNTPDKAADLVIDSYSNFIKRHVQSLTALYEGRDDGYEHPTPSPESAEYRRQVMEQVAEYPPNGLWNRLPQRIKNHFYVDIERYRRDNDTLQMAVWRIVSGLHGFIINEIVFENTGLNYRMFFTESERAQFDKIICDDYLNNVSSSITAGKVIERFKGHVLAHFMSLTGIAPGMVVR
jgi:hypothetical protein